MPPRPLPETPANEAPKPARVDFHQRYAEVERRRVELIDRLHRLTANAKAHPGHKRALTLLNNTFRKSKLAQRLAVLQAAAWLIDILERLATVV